MEVCLLLGMAQPGRLARLLAAPDALGRGPARCLSPWPQQKTRMTPAHWAARRRRSINCQLPIGTSRTSSFEFPVSSFEFRVSTPSGGPASCEFFAEAMGIGTWRGRGRARQARRGASRAYPAASFRAEATPPSGTASNFYAVILWITYQEIKGGMHCDLTKSDLDEALGVKVGDLRSDTSVAHFPIPDDYPPDRYCASRRK